MAEIKNKRYREFLDKGEIEYIEMDHIDKALSNIKGSKVREGRALLICAYYTGARPAEYLQILGKDVRRNNNYITIKVKGVKNGLTRTINIPLSKKHMKEFYDYSQTVFDNVPLFHHYISRYERVHISKKGKIVRYKEVSTNLRYWFKKWFSFMQNPPNPYFLRHNRFSSLAESGASDRDLTLIKGCKTADSITPYIHLSSARSKKVGRLLK